MFGSGQPVSLAGGSVGAPATHRSSVSAALSQLRRYVTLMAVLVAVGITVQAVVWTAVTWTDVRFERLEAAAETAPVVIGGDADSATAERTPGVAASLIDPPAPPPRANPADANLGWSKWDPILHSAAQLGGAFARLAAVALVPLIILGVLLAAASATDGVDQAVSAVAWSTLTVMLALPVARWADMPWDDAAVWRYDGLTARVDDPEHVQGAAFFGQYAVLPIGCLIAATLAAHRFAAGVRAGKLQAENLALDVGLESEAANMKPTSLHAVRGSSTALEGHDAGHTASPANGVMVAAEAPAVVPAQVPPPRVI